MHVPAKTHLAPTQIAPDTFVIHDHGGEGTAPVMVPFNSMVIRGAESVVVDTGFTDNEEHFLADVFGLVEPEDVRWVVISHDDVDHTGNIDALMEAAPNATLVVSWFMWERMGSTLRTPLDRQRWMEDGDTLDVGDRTLHLVRPPVFDSPTTRGVFDPTTGVYWASDTFAAPMEELVTSAADLPREMWIEGMHTFHQYVSPWFSMLDDRKFQRSVDRVAELGATTLAGCHAQTVPAELVSTAIEALRVYPTFDAPPMAGQEVLDMMLAGPPPVAENPAA